MFIYPIILVPSKASLIFIIFLSNCLSLLPYTFYTHHYILQKIFSIGTGIEDKFNRNTYPCAFEFSHFEHCIHLFIPVCI